MSNWTYDDSYRLTSPFGYRIHPISGLRKFHRGVDIVTTPSNGPVYAFVAGEVVHAKQSVAYSGIPAEMGIVVAIKDKTGHLHLYAHLSMVSVNVGQHVEPGAMIGRQGSTGASTGPHLHYEVRKVANPSYGWTATEAGVVEPTAYLVNYYKKDEPVVPAAPVVPEPPKEEEYMLKAEDANKVIEFLKAGYGATTDKEARDEYHRLANELRKASGQKEQ